jgi:hypothetical protein
VVVLGVVVLHATNGRAANDGAVAAGAVVVDAGATSAASAAPGVRVVRRLAVLVAHHDGGAGRARLQHARDDARAIRDVLVDVGGVEPGDVRLLVDEDRAALEEALAVAADDAARARARGERAEVVVYYSGHSDEDGLLLGEERLPWEALRDRVERIEADVRLVVLDSCASGTLVRNKGGRRRPPLVVDERTAVRGQAYLTSSAADEASQESARLGGSYFTHALVSGLRGAADVSGDGRVTLDEAYRYAFHETLATTTTTTGGVQHATREVQLSGAGELVLTDLREAAGRLVLGPDVDGRVFVRVGDHTGDRAVVAEVGKRAGAPLTLAVPRGTFDVVVVRDRTAASARVVVAADVATVHRAALTPIDLEDAVPRGLLPLTQFPINLAFVSPLEINAYAPRVENRLGLALLFGSAARLTGAGLALGGNWVDERVVGGLFALGFNGVRGPSAGALLGGANLALADMTGAMGALFVNLGAAHTTGAAWAVANVHRGLTGAQVGLVNIAGDVVGAQVGLVNIADRVTGAQVGLVNIARSSTVPIGLASLVADGAWALGVASSDLAVVGGFARAGSRFVFTEVRAGATPASWLSSSSPVGDGGWVPVVSLGLGGTVPLGATFAGPAFVDVTLHGGIAGSRRAPFAELGAILRVRPLPWLALVAGPSLRLLADDGKAIPPWRARVGDGVVLGPGFFLGAAL